MEQNYVVLQGKILEVDIQSMYWSSAYGWFLSALPEELVLLRTDIVPAKPGIAPVIHKFYFGVMTAEKETVEIKFVLAAAHELPNVADTFTAKVRIVASDAAKFAPAGENAHVGVSCFPTQKGSVNSLADMANCQQPYGFPGPYFNTSLLSNTEGCNVSDAANDTRLYAYPNISVDTPFFPSNKKMKKAKKAKKNSKSYDVTNDIRAFHNPCMATDGTDGRLYGYPCGVEDAAFKYGYPCGAQDAALKYGYPCGAQDAAFKYGYPCGVEDAAFKYGYPCGAQDAALKYGYPCGVEDAAFKYGYPCGAQDAVLKYGYPCGAQDAALNYSCQTQNTCAGDGRLYGYPLVAYGYPVTEYGFPCC